VKKRHLGTRAWYAGKNPPAAESLVEAEAVDEETRVLYDHTKKGEGDYEEVVKSLYDRMDSLKRNPAEFRTWTEEDGMETFFEVLLDFAPADLRSRVQILQRIGSFRFRAADSPDQKKAKIGAVFAQPEGDEDYKTLLRSQAKRLATIWGAKPDGLLDFFINRPAQAGRVLSDRLSPTNEQPLQLIGHPFTDVRSTVLQPLAESKTVAYERDSEIHLVLAVRKVLENWDQDAAASDGCEQFNLLDALLLHEIVEVVLDETEPDIQPLGAHIIASTFERYLKGEMLNVAVEDFFLEWPPLSSEEITERRRIELAEQLEEMSAFLEEEEVFLEEEEDLGDLPVDSAQPRPKKKKAKVKKKKIVKKSSSKK